MIITDKIDQIRRNRRTELRLIHQLINLINYTDIIFIQLDISMFNQSLSHISLKLIKIIQNIYIYIYICEIDLYIYDVYTFHINI